MPCVGLAMQLDTMQLHRGRNAHPEKPERLAVIVEKLRSTGLMAQCRLYTSARPASDHELLAVHTAEHLVSVAAASKAVSEEPSNRVLREPHGDGGVYYDEWTDHVARCAAGSALAAMEAALHGDVHRSFALVRPPGHHAEADEALGFCFYNNVAVAAAAARRQAVERIAIIDWDVHHGNGTQHIFESDPSILFISLHRFGRDFFPGSGAINECGKGDGQGRTVNIPWMQAGLGDSDYIAAFDLVVMPVLREFDPRLLLISAGFDAALGDTQGKMRVSPRGYAQLTRRLLTLSACTPVVIFEGGYNLEVSAECAKAVLEELLRDTPAERACLASSGADEPSVTSDAHAKGTRASACLKNEHVELIPPGSFGTHTERLLRQVVETQQEYWLCFREPTYRILLDEYFRPQSRKRSR